MRKNTLFHSKLVTNMQLIPVIITKARENVNNLVALFNLIFHGFHKTFSTMEEDYSYLKTS